MNRARAGRVASFLALAICLVAPSARAEVKLDKGGKLVLFGDLRLRWEDDWASTNGQGAKRAARDRVRLRARCGLKWTATKHVSFAMRVRTGSFANVRSPHSTMFHLQRNDYGRREVVLDTVTLKAQWKRTWLQFGKMSTPFWNQNEMHWDNDTPIKGLAWGFKHEAGKDAHALTVGGFFLPGSTDGLPTTERGNLWEAQYRWERKLKAGSITVAPQLLMIQDNDEHVNSLTKDRDWLIAHVAFQRRWTAPKRPWQLGVDVVHEFQGDGYTTPSGHEDLNWGGILRLDNGKVEKRGDWSGSVGLVHVQAGAVDSALGQDNWVRWDSSSNFHGIGFESVVGLTKSLNLTATLYIAEGLDIIDPNAWEKDEGKRFRLDLNWKF